MPLLTLATGRSASILVTPEDGSAASWKVRTRRKGRERSGTGASFPRVAPTPPRSLRWPILEVASTVLSLARHIPRQTCCVRRIFFMTIRLRPMFQERLLRSLPRACSRPRRRSGPGGSVEIESATIRRGRMKNREASTAAKNVRAASKTFDRGESRSSSPRRLTSRCRTPL